MGNDRPRAFDGMGCAAGMAAYALVGAVGYFLVALQVSYPEGCGSAEGELTCAGEWQGTIIRAVAAALIVGGLLAAIGGAVATTRGKTPYRWILGAWLLLVTTLGASCIVRQLPEPGRLSVEEQFTELMQRPDADAARARQTQMLREMREAISDAVDLPAWKGDPGRTGSGFCAAPFRDLDASGDAASAELGWMSPGAVPAERRDDVERIVRDIGHRYGFRPNPNAASLLHDGLGGQVDLITSRDTYLRSSTACHLEPAAKVRGRPIAVEDG